MTDLFELIIAVINIVKSVGLTINQSYDLWQV